MFLKFIEDVNDPGKVDNHTLMQMVYAFGDYSYDSETTNRATKEVYDEVIRRGH